MYTISELETAREKARDYRKEKLLSEAQTLSREAKFKEYLERSSELAMEAVQKSWEERITTPLEEYFPEAVHDFDLAEVVAKAIEVSSEFHAFAMRMGSKEANAPIEVHLSWRKWS